VWAYVYACAGAHVCPFYMFACVEVREIAFERIHM